jgi:hypothetical protein
LGVGTILSTVVAIVVGGGVALATVIGLVNSQTTAPDTSPTSVNTPAIQYGSTD